MHGAFSREFLALNQVLRDCMLGTCAQYHLLGHPQLNFCSGSPTDSIFGPIAFFFFLFLEQTRAVLVWWPGGVKNDFRMSHSIRLRNR